MSGYQDFNSRRKICNGLIERTSTIKKLMIESNMDLIQPAVEAIVENE